jgi:MinD superfamily P-loop ATPase
MIDPFLCEGCAVCESVCPHQAIQMQAVQDGFWYESKSENKPFFHAHLFPVMKIRENWFRPLSQRRINP